MADVIAILFVADVISTVMYFLADVIAISLLADVMAIVGMLLGWWQMLLPLWLLLLPLVGMMYHSMVDVIDTCLVVETSTPKTHPMSKNCRTYQHSDTLSVGYNKE